MAPATAAATSPTDVATVTHPPISTTAAWSHALMASSRDALAGHTVMLLLSGLLLLIVLVVLAVLLLVLLKVHIKVVLRLGLLVVRVGTWHYVRVPTAATLGRPSLTAHRQLSKAHHRTARTAPHAAHRRLSARRRLKTRRRLKAGRRLSAGCRWPARRRPSPGPGRHPTPPHPTQLHHGHR